MDQTHDLALMSKEAETAERMQSLKMEENMFKADMKAMASVRL